MKIALVVHTAYPDFIGGRERHIHNLASAFTGKDELVVVAGDRAGRFRTRNPGGYRLITLPMVSITVSKNPLQIYRIIPSLFSVLRKENPDLIHAFEYGSYSTDIACLYSRKHGVPLLLTVYGYQFGSPLLKFLKVIYDRLVGRRLFRDARQIFCPSKVQREEIRNIMRIKGIENKILIQKNCIRVRDYQSFVPDKRIVNKYGLGGGVKILTVVRILPRKGIIYLISALGRVVNCNREQDIQLIIVGPDCGELKNIRRKIKQLGLEKNVVITGAVNYGRIKDFLKICDIFALPSLYEGLPLALIEAMAAGKAVIFSELSCAKHIIRDGENGLLVKPGSIDSLADSITRLIKNKNLRYSLGIKARESVFIFDSQKEAREMSAYYQSLLSAPAGCCDK